MSSHLLADHPAHPSFPITTREHRQPPLSRSDVAVLVVAVSTLVTATVIDLVILPPRYLVSSLYAIPVLVAGLRLPRGMVAGIGGLAVGLNVLSVYREHGPLILWPLESVSMAMIAALAVLLAHQREETARRVQESETARASLLEFMGMVAHELGTPLTTIGLQVEALQRRLAAREEQTNQTALRTVDRACQQLKRLTMDLRDAARIGTAHFDVHPSSTDLMALAREAVAHVQTIDPGYSLIVDGPAHVEGLWDAARVQQLFTNLLSNAMKYSPGGATLRVREDVAVRQVTIEVADRGPGIPAAEISRLFRPFGRLDRDRMTPGTGLGLYISKAIAEAHGGRISVTSEPGRGSTFAVALPLSDGVERLEVR